MVQAYKPISNINSKILNHNKVVPKKIELKIKSGCITVIDTNEMNEKEFIMALKQLKNNPHIHTIEIISNRKFQYSDNVSVDTIFKPPLFELINFLDKNPKINILLKGEFSFKLSNNHIQEYIEYLNIKSFAENLTGEPFVMSADTSVALLNLICFNIINKLIEYKNFKPEKIIFVTDKSNNDTYKNLNKIFADPNIISAFNHLGTNIDFYIPVPKDYNQELAILIHNLKVNYVPTPTFIVDNFSEDLTV